MFEKFCFSPLAPQNWGGTRFKSPELVDLGGDKTLVLAKNCVYQTRSKGFKNTKWLSHFVFWCKSRLVKKIDQISQDKQRETLDILAEIFAAHIPLVMEA
ncbi:hypothetical protein B9G53_18435 [Pseudanabaena sp. SR411]|nr:hypothetical protein B9G53_18435 [Pseudanabaena sp. SR411]